MGHRIGAGLSHPDKNVRQATAVEMGELADPNLAAELTKHLFAEQDFYVRETLTWAIVRVADAAIPHILERLSTEYPSEIRTQALHVMSKIAENADPSVIEDFIHDSDPAVAQKARWALSRIGNPISVPALAQLLGTGSSEDQNSLTTALASFGNAAVPEMVTSLAHQYPAVREHAAGVLCFVGSPAADEATEALVVAVSDEHDDVAVAALMALGELTNPKAVAAVQQAISAPRQRLSETARRLCAKATEKAEVASRRQQRLDAIRERNALE